MWGLGKPGVSDLLSVSGLSSEAWIRFLLLVLRSALVFLRDSSQGVTPSHFGDLGMKASSNSDSRSFL